MGKASVIATLLCLQAMPPAAAAAERRTVTRGYLDKGYAVDSLDGRTIHFQGISKGNAKLEKTLEVAAYDQGALEMDSLYRIFNERLVQSLRQKLPRAKVVPADTLPRPDAIVLRKLIGEPVVPDSFLITVPAPPAGGEGDVSLVVGKAVLGVRSQQKIRYELQGPAGPFPHATHGPGRFKPKLPTAPRFKQRFYLEDSDPLAEQEKEANLHIKKDRQKRFYSIVEFCFYDHRSRKAFGYGWDVVETAFLGEVGKLFLGQKVSLDRHMRKQAESLVGLLLRRGDGVEHYRDSEILIVKQNAPPPEIIREELEADDEEE